MFDGLFQGAEKKKSRVFYDVVAAIKETLESFSAFIRDAEGER